MGGTWNGVLDTSISIAMVAYATIPQVALKRVSPSHPLESRSVIFTDINQTLCTSVQSLDFHPADASMVFLSCLESVWFSSDFGTSWQAITGPYSAVTFELTVQLTVRLFVSLTRVPYFHPHVRWSEFTLSSIDYVLMGSFIHITGCYD